MLKTLNPPKQQSSKMVQNSFYNIIFVYYYIYAFRLKQNFLPILNADGDIVVLIYCEGLIVSIDMVEMRGRGRLRGGRAE